MKWSEKETLKRHQKRIVIFQHAAVTDKVGEYKKWTVISFAGYHFK